MTNDSSKVPALLSSSAKCQACADRLKQDDFDHAHIKRRIEKAGYEVFRITQLSTNLGFQYFLLGGGVVTVYNTGTVDAGGRITDREKARLKRQLRSRPH